MQEITTVTNANGLSFAIVLVREGESYGRTGSLVHDKSDPLVEIYDTRFPHTQYGQFVSRYYLSTLMEGHNPNVGLNMDGAIPNWSLDAAALNAALIAIGAALRPAEDDSDLVYARCLVCGYEACDDITLEFWNGLGDHDGPTWHPACTDHSLWVHRDGSVTVINGDSERHDIDAPEDCCSGCGYIDKISHMKSYYRKGIDPCGVMYCPACDSKES